MQPVTHCVWYVGQAEIISQVRMEMQASGVPPRTAMPGTARSGAFGALPFSAGGLSGTGAASVAAADNAQMAGYAGRLFVLHVDR